MEIEVKQEIETEREREREKHRIREVQRFGRDWQGDRRMDRELDTLDRSI